MKVGECKLDRMLKAESTRQQAVVIQNCPRERRKALLVLRICLLCSCLPACLVDRIPSLSGF